MLGWLADVPPVTMLGDKLCAREHQGGAATSNRNSSKEMIRRDLKDLCIKMVTAT